MDSRQFYERYMRSDKWAKKRQEYRDSGRPVTCRKCGRPDVQFHHRTYKRFTDEAFDDLVPLCQDHHSDLHTLQRDQGLRVEDATRLYLAKPKKAKRPQPTPKPRPTRAERERAKLNAASLRRRQAEIRRRGKIGLPPIPEVHHSEPRRDDAGLIRSSGKAGKRRRPKPV